MSTDPATPLFVVSDGDDVEYEDDPTVTQAKANLAAVECIQQEKAEQRRLEREDVNTQVWTYAQIPIHAQIPICAQIPAYVQLPTLFQPRVPLQPSAHLCHSQAPHPATILIIPMLG